MRRRWWTVALIGAVCLAIGLVGAGMMSYRSMKATMEQIYVPIERSAVSNFGNEVEISSTDSAKRATPIKNRQPFSVLVIGVDEREKDRGRSDTLMVMAVNPNRESTLLFNIPRDTRTKIPGHGEDKINHAYAFGGVEGSIRAVENFLNAPIDYYVLENMEGFARLVDTFDGVTVDNAFEFEYEDHTFPQGVITLDGEEALKYSRMRFDDPRGDLGRSERQRQIVKALVAEATEAGNLLEMNEIMDDIADTVRTNVSFKEAKLLAADYRSAFRRFETLELRGSGKKIDGIYYYIVGEEERARLRQRYIGQLGLLDAAK